MKTRKRRIPFWVILILAFIAGMLLGLVDEIIREAIDYYGR